MKNGIKAVVLAAGKGTRLRTEGVDLPKVLRQAAGRPLLGYVLEELSFLEKEDVGLVVGHKREGNDCTLLSAVSDEELPYGRIVRKSDGSFSHIVEDKDCTPEEKAIRELNVGVYVFESRPLWEAIDQLRPNNAQGEYYLTDAPAYILSRGGRVGACPTCTAEEMLGVNTVEQLAQVEELVRRREGLK